MSFTAHTDHCPRPAGDPDYVPYWARGEFARKGGYSYTTESGYTLRDGELTGRLPRTPRSEPVLTPQPLRSGPKATPPKAVRTPDRVQELLAEHRTRDSRLALCATYGVDPTIFTGAPNPGVAAMRLANALRKALA
jgi:hypothetical protein